MTETNQVIHGDCMDVLAEMEDNSIDTIITDPPYHLGSISKRFTKTSLSDDNDTAANARNGSNQYARLSTGFMGKSWDGGGIAFQPELWAEMLRVAKPGAMLLAFGGTRTHHRLMVAIEDAGWEIRDCISHFHAADSREADLLDSMTDEQRQAYLELHYSGQNYHWVYGSGFPKSHSIEKAMEKKIIKAIEDQGYEFTGWIDE